MITNEKTEDEKGRQIRPILGNTEKDGSGTWYHLVVDTEGKLKISEPNVEKSITFSGATPNAIGDFDGTGNPATVFTVTGTVKLTIIAVCTTNLAFNANATIALGTAAAPTSIITTTDLTVSALAAQEIWHDATPDAEIELLSVAKECIVTDGNDIVLTVGVANVNTGVIRFNCEWKPVSSDGLVVAA